MAWFRRLQEECLNFSYTDCSFDPLMYLYPFLFLSSTLTEVMCTHGGMKLSSDILGHPNASAVLVRAIVGFMRNLCADDVRKENLGSSMYSKCLIKTVASAVLIFLLICLSSVFDGSMALMVAAMSEKRFSQVVHRIVVVLKK